MAQSDTEQLHALGYAQELRRGMRTFSNFAVSFTIISILSGCLTLFYFAMNTGGPAVMTLGWLVLSLIFAAGYDKTAPVVVQAFAAQVEEALQSPDDFKSLLQEKLARRGDVVEYVIVREEGPPHARSFESVAQVEGEEIGRGAGKSKKSAEQSAALAALTAMDND